MYFHLSQIPQDLGHPVWLVVLDPLIPTTAYEQQVPTLRQWADSSQLAFNTHVITALRVQGHWVPIIIQYGAQVRVIFYDATTAHIDAVHQIANLLQVADPTPIEIAYRPRPVHPFGMCGPVAILCIRDFLNCPIMQSDDLVQQSWQMRQLFTRLLEAKTTCLAPSFWGAGGEADQLQVQLASVLEAHGVPSNLSHDRARLGLHAIGVTPIQQAITSKAQWKALKVVGSQAKQWIRLDELQAQVDQRAATGQAVGRKNKRPSPKETATAQVQVQVPATQVIINKGTFVQEPDIPLGAILLQQVGPCVAGVAILNEGEAEPYLRNGRSISSQAFAAIVLKPLKDLMSTKLQCEEIQFPAMCAVTGEAIILRGTLIQLGEKKVLRPKPAKLLQVEVVPSVAFRFTVYRDQIEGEWSEVIAKPIRYITDHVPLLTLCKEPACECPAWHNQQKLPTQGAILDLWKRAFLTSRFKQTAPQRADIFCVNIRIPLILIDEIQTSAGQAGIYMEPKAEDGRLAHPDYQVVWIPKVSLREAQMTKQANLTATCVARNGDRYGVRTRIQHAPALHKQLRPDVPFLGSADRTEYEVGPLPRGTQREAIIKLFQEWGWHARPITAVTTNTLGTTWKVQATLPPPSSTVDLAHGSILVTPTTDKPAREIPPTPVIASYRTFKTFQAGEDPLTVHDPWLASRAKPSATQAKPDTAVMLNIEQQVNQAVKDHIAHAMQDADMGESSKTDNASAHERIDQLEQRIAQAAQVQSAQAEQRFRGIEEHITGLQEQVQIVSTQTSDNARTMQSLFDQQMSRIEVLLGKRSGARSRSRPE